MSELNIKPEGLPKPFIALAGLAAVLSVAGVLVAVLKKKKGSSLEGKKRKVVKRLEKLAKDKKKQFEPLKAQATKSVKEFKKQAKAQKKRLAR